jgi:hypothetical protein
MEERRREQPFRTLKSGMRAHGMFSYDCGEFRRRIARAASDRRDCRALANTYIRGRFSPESPAPTSVPPSPDTPTEVGPSYLPQLWSSNGRTRCFALHSALTFLGALHALWLWLFFDQLPDTVAVSGV